MNKSLLSAAASAIARVHKWRNGVKCLKRFVHYVAQQLIVFAAVILLNVVFTDKLTFGRFKYANAVSNWIKLRRTVSRSRICRIAYYITEIANILKNIFNVVLRRSHWSSYDTVENKIQTPMKSLITSFNSVSYTHLVCVCVCVCVRAYKRL